MKTNDLIQELGTNFIEYAVEVNTDRAIPDATSGLKPVARRILWGASQMGAASSKPHVKCATIVGEIMGKYHPHGDSSIYLAMARLAQDWVMRYPLIDWHGNKGNIIGANPSAYRYTEARLSKLSEEGMLANIKKKNVDFGLNYSDTLDEPLTLPAIFPNLLCNPNTGIGVAMACNWAPHNLNEVAQAIFDYMDGKEPMLPGPDFPTGGIIINKDDIPQIMKTGHGSVKIRGKYKIEGQKIIFYEIPYGLTIQGLLDEIAAHCDAKEIEGVKRITDDSNKKGIRLVIECERTAAPEAVVQLLFEKTNLQSSFSYNQVALINKTPTELNLKDCVKIYVDHNVECLKKEVHFDLDKASARLNIIEGLLIALEDIDAVIKMIKASESAAAAKQNLITKYHLSDTQAQAILDMKLAKLAHLEKIELENEKQELMEKIKGFNTLLGSTELQFATIKERLGRLVAKFGDKRRTELAQIATERKAKEKPVVEPKDCVVIINKKGSIKRIDAKNFKAQKRNTIGVKTNGDIIVFSQKTNTQDTLMVFSSLGKMYRVLVDNIPEGTNTSIGTPLSAIIQFEKNEVPMAYTTLTRDTDKQFIFFATKNGIIKKVPLEEYDNMKRTGVLAIKFKEGDSLAAVTFINQEQMMLITKNGMSIRFETKEMPISSRIAQGVKGMNVAEDDQVVAALPISNPADYLVVVSESGLGKKTKLEEFTIQNRGGKGLACYKGKIAGGAIIGGTGNLLINGNKTAIVIESKDIPVLSRISSGNIMIKNNDSVIAIANI